MRQQPPNSSFSLMFTLMLTITSRKKTVEVENSGKTMTFYESIHAFAQISETTNVDGSNYRLFESIPAVPGTSNHQGLTV